MAPKETLPTLWISFENNFCEEYTLPDLLPFPRCCTTLILCGTALTPALSRQLNVLSLDSRELDQTSTTLTEAVSLLSTYKIRDFFVLHSERIARLRGESN